MHFYSAVVLSSPLMYTVQVKMLSQLVVREREIVQQQYFRYAEEERGDYCVRHTVQCTNTHTHKRTRHSRYKMIIQYICQFQLQSKSRIANVVLVECYEMR